MYIYVYIQSLGFCLMLCTISLSPFLQFWIFECWQRSYSIFLLRYKTGISWFVREKKQLRRRKLLSCFLSLKISDPLLVSLLPLFFLCFLFKVYSLKFIAFCWWFSCLKLCVHEKDHFFPSGFLSFFQVLTSFSFLCWGIFLFPRLLFYVMIFFFAPSFPFPSIDWGFFFYSKQSGISNLSPIV